VKTNLQEKKAKQAPSDSFYRVLC